MSDPLEGMTVAEAQAAARDEADAMREVLWLTLQRLYSYMPAAELAQLRAENGLVISVNEGGSWRYHLTKDVPVGKVVLRVQETGWVTR